MSGRIVTTFVSVGGLTPALMPDLDAAGVAAIQTGHRELVYNEEVFIPGNSLQSFPQDSNKSSMQMFFDKSTRHGGES